MNNFIKKLIETKKIIVCVGSGGVGKTTISAAIGLKATEMGLKTLVLTIDPARRLADSLGIKLTGNEIVRVPNGRFLDAGIKTEGSLFAMMLDTKSTFDSMIERFASEETSAKILANDFYQNISSTLTGTQDYMALERLLEVVENEGFDRIVLDTPPTKHALDFLDSPKRIISFLDSNAIGWIVKPSLKAGVFGLKLFSKSDKFMYLFEKVTGVRLLKDIGAFFTLFDGMYDLIKQRADNAGSLIKGDDAAFIVVTSPNVLTVDEAIFFYEKLVELEMPCAGFLVNRVHRHYSNGAETNFGGADRSFDFTVHDEVTDALERLLPTLQANAERMAVIRDIDKRSIKKLLASTHSKSVVEVPLFDHDIFNVEGLAALNEYIFADK